MYYCPIRHLTKLGLKLSSFFIIYSLSEISTKWLQTFSRAEKLTILWFRGKKLKTLLFKKCLWYLGCSKWHKPSRSISLASGFEWIFFFLQYLMELYSWSNDLLPHLNLFSSSSVETEKILSMQQSPTSNASQELHKKFHFCSVCRSCTMILATYLNTTNFNSRKKQ